ncbi:MAG: 16S rRNA (adenine(1518)-N(6)/adenine(1519)-N(6))-dimethyltransferase RsmA [Candidatus Paceibacterota bacterium]
MDVFHFFKITYAEGVIEKFQTKKSLGQHFLNSPMVPRWLCEAGEVKEGDIIVEVGPGTGALTAELLESGAKVVALEADLRAVEILKERFLGEVSSGQLKIWHVDVRRFDTADLKLSNHSFKMVSNIPYYLTGQLFRTFISGKIQPSLLVFLVQKVAGERATAALSRGEKESLLSLSIQAFGTPRYVKTVSRGHFTPPPKVDSAIIAVHNINQNNFKNLSTDQFFEILHLGFGSKRKQLVGNLSKKYEREKVLEALNVVDLPENVRAEDVLMEKWLQLALILAKISKND